MERDSRNSDRGRRDDKRSHKPRRGESASNCLVECQAINDPLDEDRSRSPPRRDRRDDRRRERSPQRDAPRGGAGRGADRERDAPRNRDAPPAVPPARRAAGDRPPAREKLDGNRPNATPPSAQEGTETTAGVGGKATEEDMETEMQRIMGFKAFNTTKDTKVPGNEKNYAISKVKKAEYRQYMNRTGGFNRPLSPSRM